MSRTHATAAAEERRQSSIGNQNGRSINLSAFSSGLQSIEAISEFNSEIINSEPINSKFNSRLSDKEDGRTVSASATGSSSRRDFLVKDILISDFDFRKIAENKKSLILSVITSNRKSGSLFF